MNVKNLHRRKEALMKPRVPGGSVVLLAFLAAVAAFAQHAGGVVGGVEVEDMPIPPGVDVFDLNLEQTRFYSRSKNFEVVGQSYFKGPWLGPFALANKTGAGFNTVRVHKGIAYLGGYNTPATLFGVLIADVEDPRDMKALSLIPCNPGTRCNYLRFNPKRQILVVGHDADAANPTKPPAGQSVQAGISFHDVSDPRNPKLLGFSLSQENGDTHGLEIDDRYVYTCANTTRSRKGKDVRGSNEELLIIDYNDPTRPALVGSLHIKGQHLGETFEPQDQRNPDGSPQLISCHEINLHKGRLYIAYRDAGTVIVDVTDPRKPSVISRLDYVPPFNGGRLGAAHTSAPVVVDADKHPTLVVHTDEIFECPPGFGRIIDISNLSSPQVISSFRVPHIADNFDYTTGKFICPPGQQSIHYPWFDFRSPSLFYVAWYDQGLRAWDISNPFMPREVGYYLSPKYAPPGRPGRQTRESFQDPETGLIYMTDGNGGGLTVLRWIGPIPSRPPIPGGR